MSFTEILPSITCNILLHQIRNEFRRTRDDEYSNFTLTGNSTMLKQKVSYTKLLVRQTPKEDFLNDSTDTGCIGLIVKKKISKKTNNQKLILKCIYYLQN